MTEHAVVIAGGGPTGLMLAAELALAGVDVVVVERRTDQSVDGSRAGGLLPRTIEVLDQRGIAERFVSAGRSTRPTGSPWSRWTSATSPSRHNYVLALWQSQFEPILADWVLGELGVPILRGRRGGWASPRTTPASRSSCPTVRRCGRRTSSAATAGAASSARLPASTSPVWSRRPAG